MSRQRAKVELVIADEHPVFLRGLANLFKGQPDIKVVAQCSDGHAALAAIRTHAPDIAMIDIAMPGLDGLAVLEAVSAERRPTRILLLASELSDTQMMNAVAGGAKGIVFKTSSAEEIARSVRRVAAGKYQFPRELAEAMRRRRRKRPKVQRALTPREVEVTRLVIKGLSNKEIGRQMQLSEGTVKIHLHNIYKKLGVANRTALAALMAGR